MRKVKNKKDYLINDLPHNRKEVILDILKIRYDLIFKIGLILFVFLIPFIASCLVKNLYLSTIHNNYMDGAITEEAYYQALSFWNITFIFIQAIAFLFVSIGLAGVCRIIKRLVFYESIQFKEDFNIGIKTNIKHIFYIILLSSILFIILSILSLNMLSNNDSSFINTIIYFLPLALTILIIYPIFLLTICETPIYTNTFSLSIKNAFYFYGKTIFKTIGISLLFALPYLLLLIKNVYVNIIIFIILILFILPIELIIFFVYSCSIFDKYLNINQYKEIYDKGIHRK